MRSLKVLRERIYSTGLPQSGNTGRTVECQEISKSQGKHGNVRESVESVREKFLILLYSLSRMNLTPSTKNIAWKQFQIMYF